MSEPGNISELFVWVIVKPNGDEEIPEVLVKDHWVPLFGALRSRADSMRETIQDIANDSGYPVKLIQLSSPMELDLVRPEPEPLPKETVQ